jgi:hypothetical protein
MLVDEIAQHGGHGTPRPAKYKTRPFRSLRRWLFAVSKTSEAICNYGTRIHPNFAKSGLAGCGVVKKGTKSRLERVGAPMVMKMLTFLERVRRVFRRHGRRATARAWGEHQEARAVDGRPIHQTRPNAIERLRRRQRGDGHRPRHLGERLGRCLTRAWGAYLKNMQMRVGPMDDAEPRSRGRHTAARTANAANDGSAASRSDPVSSPGQTKHWLARSKRRRRDGRRRPGT